MQITVTSASLRRNCRSLFDILWITINSYFVRVIYITISGPFCFICNYHFCSVWNCEVNSVLFKNGCNFIFIAFRYGLDPNIITLNCSHIRHFIFYNKRIWFSILFLSRIDGKLIFSNKFIFLNRWFIQQLLFNNSRSPYHFRIYCCWFSAEGCFILHNATFAGCFNRFQVSYFKVICKFVIFMIILSIFVKIGNNKFQPFFCSLRLYLCGSVIAVILSIITVFYFKALIFIQI